MIKIDNIENYTLKCLYQIKDSYEKFLEKSDGVDPDFPTIGFGNSSGGEKIKGVNKIQAQALEENNEVN